jgi:protein Xni
VRPSDSEKVVTRVLLIDGFNLIRRIYEAHPDAEDDIEAVAVSATRSLQRALKTHQPSHAAVVLECHDTTWRHLLYSEYKAGRKPTPSPLLEGIHLFEKHFAESGIASYSLNNYEADDVIATLAAGIVRAGGEVIILSTDKSFLQLIRPGLRIFDHFKQSEYLESEVVLHHGVRIAQLTDFWAMTGVASNSIKGVPKVGKKTAAELLSRYSSLEEILSSDEGDDDKKVHMVQAESILATRCKQLVTLKQDVELGVNLRAFRL